MKCPNCNETLLITHRNNIEIDYCPSCRGIWLDKGELDKLLVQDARSVNNEPVSDDHYRHPEHTDNRQRHPKKKKSFLGDLFDFD